jgi:hypothetical protein
VVGRTIVTPAVVENAVIPTARKELTFQVAQIEAQTVRHKKNMGSVASKLKVVKQYVNFYSDNAVGFEKSGLRATSRRAQ